jgi:hypothetical protein
MDDDRKDLIGHIFATATARLETAHGIAVEGQSPDRDPAAIRAIAGRLRGIAAEVITLADTASLLAREDEDSDPVVESPEST